MRSRRPSPPPSGAGDCVSRHQAAALLGFGSEYPIRQLEKAGQLRAVRGAMRQAWYPRAEVMALATTLSNRGPATRGALTAPAPATARPQEGAAGGRWTDSALIALLRQRIAGEGGQAPPRPRTAVDLVAETGITIARATRVHRFWLAHDVDPTAALARALATPQSPRKSPTGRAVVAADANEQSSPVGPSPAAIAVPGERRGPSRMERDGLIRALRDPDPAVRARAFQQLRPSRKP